MKDIQIRLVEKYDIRPKILLESSDKDELLSRISELIEKLEDDGNDLVGFYVSREN